MKINPMMNAGIVLMHNDGTFELAPLQVFESASGSTVIRIGNNALFFTPDGEFDGFECHVPKDMSLSDSYGQRLTEAFIVQGANKGKAPAEPYFEPGSNGWKKEVAAWDEPADPEKKGFVYLAKGPARDPD